MTLETAGRKRADQALVPIPGLGREMAPEDFREQVAQHPFAISGAYRNHDGKREIAEAIEQINLRVGTYAILARGNGDWTQHDNAVIERAVLNALLRRK